MKRSEYSRILRHMEHLREESHEAETKRDANRAIAEYGRLSKAIRPFTTGAQALEEDTPEEAAGERAAWAAAR